ncbi:hypothetical protein [Risungbinella massiliensis]|uniref:hypothetical protein n=1 Tax=Risungbinella massiliensis TaxID=1329796 RepID=UPI0005CC6FBD|nr:hypothetical protein [Risungbinella massiliensis]
MLNDSKNNSIGYDYRINWSKVTKKKIQNHCSKYENGQRTWYPYQLAINLIELNLMESPALAGNLMAEIEVPTDVINEVQQLLKQEREVIAGQVNVLHEYLKTVENLRKDQEDYEQKRCQYFQNAIKDDRDYIQRERHHSRSISSANKQGKRNAYIVGAFAIIGQLILAQSRLASIEKPTFFDVIYNWINNANVQAVIVWVIIGVAVANATKIKKIIGKAARKIGSWFKGSM